MNSNTNTTALNVFSRRSVVAMGFAALAGAAVLAAGLPVNAQAAERTVKIGTEGTKYYWKTHSNPSNY